MLDPLMNGNNRKRKRDLTSVAISEENEAKDTTMVLLPFEKKLPIWKRFESMEVFKTFPHFSPLLETREDSREISAVGMMLIFSSLLEAVKDVQPEDPISSLTSLSYSFAELKKHGFDVKVPELQISKLLSLRCGQAKKMEELKGAEKDRIKVENEDKILELQMLNEEAVKEIAEIESQSCEAMIVHLLEDFQ